MAGVLPRSFYERPAPEVAQALLGCLLLREVGAAGAGAMVLVGRIVEVEAYLGAEDAASHAHRGPTPRSRVMFGPAGHAYVYLIYGMHFCLNVVTGLEGEGAAVLIRAVEPLAGIDFMQQQRRQEGRRLLANGPGKLCQAFSIDRSQNGYSLTVGAGLWIQSADAEEGAMKVCSSPRVGVRGDAHARSVAWRFFLGGCPFVSPTPYNRGCRAS